VRPISASCRAARDRVRAAPEATRDSLKTRYSDTLPLTRLEERARIPLYDGARRPSFDRHGHHGLERRPFIRRARVQQANSKYIAGSGSRRGPTIGETVRRLPFDEDLTALKLLPASHPPAGLGEPGMLLLH